MSDTLLASVQRIGTAGLSLLRPQRSPWRAALFALAVTAGVTGMKPAALAQVVGEFEIDGNTIDDTTPPENTAPFDWADANVANGFGRTDFRDPPAGVDTTFTKGSKEDDPNGWNYETPPLSGSEPGKGDILSGGIAFRVVNVLGVPQQFMFVNFTVAAGQGDVHIDYEFNQSANTVVNGAGFAIPERTSGDIVISFNQGGNNQLVPKVFQWTGTGLSGTFADITPSFTAADFLSALSLDTLFGEAGINFSKITSNALCGVNSFKKVWAKTRSSEAFTSVLKDRTLQSDILVCDDGNACTDDQCDINSPSTGYCSHTPITCNDGVACTVDTCNPSTGCVFTPNNGACNDENGCTTDTCSATGGCSNTPNVGQACGDPSSGICDRPDTCDANGICQPNHQPTTTQCRASGGACDVPEFCNASGTCPADRFVVGGTTCRASAGVCDLPETCTGSSAECPADAKSTAVCRPSAGVCDVEESCDGVGNNCPADGFASSSTVCRLAAGVCDLTENCTGGAAACPADLKSTAVCRASGGECDIAESCNGSSNNCPADAKTPAGTACTADDHACTVDQCDGTQVTCQHTGDPGNPAECAPPSLVKSVRNVTAGTTTFTTDTTADPGDTVEFQLVFTAGADANDNNTVITDPVPDHCNYVADSCSDGNPNNNPDCTTSVANGVTTIKFDAVNVPAGTQITVTFQCTIDNPLADGTKVTNFATSDFDENGQTPPDSNDSTVTVHSECVTNDDCVTTNPCAQNLCVTGHCQFPAGHEGDTCRAAADVCDVAETCTGSSTECPADGFAPSAQLCRGAAGVCDVDDFCTGSGAACPADAKSTAECRPSAGVCDVPERCDGVNNDCPADGFAPSSQLCRGAAGVCDVDDFCTGSSADCSADLKRPDGTSCADTDKCNGDETCGAGTCQPGTAPVCNSHNVCITDSCDPATGCVRANNSNPCDDNLFCNGTDTCAAGSCSIHSGDPCGDAFECTIDTCSEEDVPHCKHTPEDTICNDNNDCTLDKCVGAGGDALGCENTADTVSTATSRAYGASVKLGGSQAFGPSPDSDVKNPDDLLAVPALPAADVRVLHVEESQTSDANGAAASAEASTAKVLLIQQAVGSLVSVDAIQAIVTCNANETTAECSSARSTLTNVKINGDGIGDVTEPTDLKVDLPGLLVAHVQLLEQIGRGANAGVPQPADQKFSSGLTINAIHVTVTLGNTVLTEVIVGHAEADVSFGNANTCEPGPRVSGRAYVIGREQPQDVLTIAQIGEVNLPPTGGAKNATLGDIGPIGNGSNTLAQSRTAASHTDGTVDTGANTASSNSYAFIEDLDLIDTGSDPTHPLVGADLVRSECKASANSDGSTSSGTSKLIGLTIGGQDVCTALGLGTTCDPAPNTPFPLPLPGTTITLNEQYCDGQTPTPNVTPSCTGGNTSGITVNAVHIKIDGLDAIGLGEIILSSAHCDAANTPQ